MSNSDKVFSRHNKKEPIVKDKRSLAYPTRTLDPPISLVDRVKEIETAHESIKSHVNSKLNLILKQIQTLQEEAREIVSTAERDAELHRIKCNFEKQIGKEIHLYKKDTGEKYFSMLSPREWKTPPHEYLGTYVLKGDQSFEEVESI